MKVERFRDGLKAVLVLGLVLAPLISNHAWGQQIEPLAGTWKTWVLTSGSQLRLPPPPADLFGTEIAEVRTLESQRNAAAPATPSNPRV